MKNISFQSEIIPKGFKIFITGNNVSIIEYFLVHEVFYLHTEADKNFANFLYGQNIGFTGVHILPIIIKENSFKLQLVTLLVVDPVILDRFMDNLKEFFNSEMNKLHQRYHKELGIEELQEADVWDGDESDRFAQ